MVTDSSGTKLAEMGHFPYGESWYNASNDKLLFTSYERDSESGNDYAMARSYISRFGRFSCVDPVLGSPDDPQSWNRYAYVRNNPVSMSDPTGQWWLTKLFGGIIAALGVITQDPALFKAGLDIAGASTFSSGIDRLIGANGGTPPIFDGGPLSDSQATLSSIYNPVDPSKFGIQNFTADRFGPCQKASGDLNIMHYLTRDSYNSAKTAAADASVPLPEVLDLWYQEGSLMTEGTVNGHDLWTPRKKGDVGPMQVTTVGAQQLRNLKQLPDDYDTDFDANMLAGARLFSWIKKRQTGGNPFAAYHVGPRGARLGRGQDYQQAFNNILPVLSAFVKCVGD